RRFSHPTCVSKQLDVIIHDSFNYAPIFRSGEFVIVLPQSVVEIVEVKKTLDSGELKDGLEKLALANQVLMNGLCDLTKIFTGIFAFSEAEDMQVVSKPYSSSYKNRIQEACQSYSADIAIPDCVLAVGRHLFYREYMPVIAASIHHVVK